MCWLTYFLSFVIDCSVARDAEFSSKLIVRHGSFSARVIFNHLLFEGIWVVTLRSTVNSAESLIGIELKSNCLGICHCLRTRCFPLYLYLIAHDLNF